MITVRASQQPFDERMRLPKALQMLLLAAGCLLAGSVRETAAQEYFDSPISYSSHFNCLTGNFEYLTGQWVGYFGVAGGTFPLVGDVYYGHIVVGTVGNPCAGVYVVPEVTLPPNTVLAISATNKVRCFSTLPGQATVEFTSQSSCRQTPRTVGNTYGQYSFLNTPDGGAWPLGTGAYLEITFPMRSTAPPAGSLTGYVRSIDGVGNPWTTSSTFVSVAYPSVSYPNPSFTNLTQTSVRLLGKVTNGGGSGTAYFDSGLTTSYGTSHAVAIANTFTSWSVWDDLSSLSPGTTYHWRLRYVTSGGTTYTGSDRTFTTLGASPPGAFNKTAPTNGATGQATSPTLSWGASSGASSYAYCYDTTNNNACGTSWVSAGASTSATIGGLSAGTTYYWHVRATNGGGTTYAHGSSTAFWSFTTVALPTFTDNPLQLHTIPIKAVHIMELRQRVGELRARSNLAVPVWTDASLVGTTIKTAHVIELRTALNAVYTAAGRALPTYTHSTITPRVTMVTAADIDDVRAAILGIW